MLRQKICRRVCEDLKSGVQTKLSPSNLTELDLFPKENSLKVAEAFSPLPLKKICSCNFSKAPTYWWVAYKCKPHFSDFTCNKIWQKKICNYTPSWGFWFVDKVWKKSRSIASKVARFSRCFVKVRNPLRSASDDRSSLCATFTPFPVQNVPPHSVHRVIASHSLLQQKIIQQRRSNNNAGGVSCMDVKAKVGVEFAVCFHWKEVWSTAAGAFWEAPQKKTRSSLWGLLLCCRDNGHHSCSSGKAFGKTSSHFLLLLGFIFNRKVHSVWSKMSRDVKKCCMKIKPGSHHMFLLLFLIMAYVISKEYMCIHTKHWLIDIRFSNKTLLSAKTVNSCHCNYS